MSNSSRFSRSGLSVSTYQSRTITVDGKSASNNQDVPLKLTFLRILGKGTFGCIEEAELNDRKDHVAVKRVFQDPRYKNRELNILLGFPEHPNLVRLVYYYYTKVTSSSNNTTNKSARSTNAAAATNATAGNAASSDSNSEVYLNLVMECFPESLADLIVRNCRRNTKIPMLAVKLYTFQMMRALGFIHLKNICHRDIKSSNLLVNEATGQVKLCDFGSAKEIVPGQVNVAYISSRYYRAPELIFGAEHYDCAIDIWSAGCVLAELLLRKCLFMGSDSVDQLAEIIKILGTPSLADVQAMNPKYSSYSFPNVPRCPLKLYLPMETPSDVVSLLSQMLTYRPSSRIKPLAALLHPAFNDLHPHALSSSSSNITSDTATTAPPQPPPPAAAATVSSANRMGSATSSSVRIPPDLLKFVPCELQAEPQLQTLQTSSDVTTDASKSNTIGSASRQGDHSK